jgi:hypothetical protein
MAGPVFQAFAAEAPSLIPGGVAGIDISFFKKI